MELNESTSEGAVRETWEEAMARVRVDAPYAYWDIPAIGQVRLQRPFKPPSNSSCGKCGFQLLVI